MNIKTSDVSASKYSAYKNGVNTYEEKNKLYRKYNDLAEKYSNARVKAINDRTSIGNNRKHLRTISENLEKINNIIKSIPSSPAFSLIRPAISEVLDSLAACNFGNYEFSVTFRENMRTENDNFESMVKELLKTLGIVKKEIDQEIEKNEKYYNILLKYSSKYYSYERSYRAIAAKYK